jgi:hypothetical protein
MNPKFRVLYHPEQDAASPVTNEANVPETPPAVPTDADIVDWGPMGAILNTAGTSEEVNKAIALEMAKSDPAIEVPADAAKPDAPKVEVEKKVETPSAPAVGVVDKREWTLNGKTFDSAEELAQYARGLEDSNARAQAALDADNPPPKKEKFSDVIFADPEKAEQLLNDELDRRIEARLEGERRISAKAEATRDAWTRFYSSNPDLKGFETIVDAQLAAIIKEKGAEFPRDKALPIIAERSRAELQRVAKQFAPAKELSRANTTTAGASGAQVPVVTPEPQVTDFTTQIKSLRQKGKLKGA